MFYPNPVDIQDIWVTQYPQFNFGLNAVTDVGFTQSTPKRELNLLGRQTSDLLMDGPFTYTISISKHLINYDTLWNECTGAPVGIIIGYKTQRHTTITGYIEAHSGYIESYSMDANVGEVPKASVSFIFDNAKEFYNSSVTGVYTPPATSNDYNIAYLPQSGISLNIGSDEGSCLVQSVSFSAKFNIQKEPIVISDVNDSANRGNYFISRVVRPISYNASVTMLLKDYRVNEFLFRNPKTWELTLQNDLGPSSSQTFTVPNAELVGESVNITAEGIPTVNLEYQGVG